MVAKSTPNEWQILEREVIKIAATCSVFTYVLV